jgi:pimeloyl-ACP methyl ester carboxylesterase
VQFSETELRRIQVPMLIVRGEDDDDIAGPGAEIARVIPGCEYVELPRRNHMTAVGDRGFKEAVGGFLQKRP